MFTLSNITVRPSGIDGSLRVSRIVENYSLILSGVEQRYYLEVGGVLKLHILTVSDLSQLFI